MSVAVFTRIISSTIFTTILYILAYELIPTDFLWCLPESLHPLRPVDANTTVLIISVVGFAVYYLFLPYTLLVSSKWIKGNRNKTINLCYTLSVIKVKRFIC